MHSCLGDGHCLLEYGKGLSRGGVGGGKSVNFAADKTVVLRYLVCDAIFDITVDDGDRIQFNTG